MKIIVVGATGTIGKEVAGKLQGNNEVICASRNGDVKVDITSKESIKKMFEQTGNFDALVCCAGGAHYGEFGKMEEEDFYKGIRGKLLGQINLVLIGKDYINPNGVFTLTSGMLSDKPNKNASGISTVNGAINSFVKAASIELENGVRINAVSPGLVSENRKSLFPGFDLIPIEYVVNGYLHSIYGTVTGKVFEIFP